MQALINDKGYTFLDIRTGKEYRSGNGLHWCAAACCALALAAARSRRAPRPQDVAAAG